MKKRDLSLSHPPGFTPVRSDYVGNLGGILCIWDPNSFRRSSFTRSDYFVIVRGVWLKSGIDLMIVVVYAPQEAKEKRMLWDYLAHVSNQWVGKLVMMGDFNEINCHPKLHGGKLKFLKGPVFGAGFSISLGRIRRQVVIYFLKDELRSCDGVIDKEIASIEVVHKTYGDSSTRFFSGDRSELNIDSLVRVLDYFFRASGLRINMCKSKIMGVNVEDEMVKNAASKLGCLVLKIHSLFGYEVGGKYVKKGKLGKK
ncbi:RNA-directed DNA polymerase, eukaryota [Tanacetum coccineum]